MPNTTPKSNRPTIMAGRGSATTGPDPAGPGIQTVDAPSNETVHRRVVEVIGGVDTHADVHCVAALDQLGALLGTTVVPATPDGYRHGLAWLAEFGPISRVGVEGTGSYGAGLTRTWTRAGIKVIEVNRPNRAVRRSRGKSDPIDAEQAARAVLAGTATATPKTRDGIVEAIRSIHSVRGGAVKARTAALNEFQALLITAPDQLRTLLTARSLKSQLTTAATFRPGGDLTHPTHAVKLALRRLARRIHTLDTEITDADLDLDQLTQQAAPTLRARYGIGPASSAQLLITAGDNPDRLHSDASFAALCGASPIPASSGKTSRHRLNRGGDRQANRALHTIAITRARSHPPTRRYLATVTARNKTHRDAIRLLKRHLAREIYRLLTNPTNPEAALITTS